MPRYESKPLPPGFQIVRRSEGYFLQRQVGPDLWRDVAGPYTQRWSAAQRAEREAKREEQGE